MAFWSDAIENFGNNVSIVAAAVSDVGANLNPFSDQFLTGDATNTAREVEEQLAAEQGREVNQARIDASATGGLELILDAGSNTTAQLGEAVGDALEETSKVAGGLLDLVTNKWFLAAAAGVTVLVLVAPYAAPVVAKVVK